MDSTFFFAGKAAPAYHFAKLVIKFINNLAAAVDSDPTTRNRLKVVFLPDYSVSVAEPGVFDPILDILLAKGDFYMHLADLRSYSEARARLGQFYCNPAAWARTATLNLAASGKISSDRTIAQCASEIWNVVPCPVIDRSNVAVDAF